MGSNGVVAGGRGGIVSRNVNVEKTVKMYEREWSQKKIWMWTISMDTQMR